MSTINKILPIPIQEKISTFPESSYGAHCITIILADGRVFKEVYVAGNDTVIKVGNSEVFFERKLFCSLQEPSADAFATKRFRYP